MKVWYDEYSLNVGDSLSASIDHGLSISNYGIVILSKKFFEKGWTKQELGALITKQANSNKRIILPIWHNISREEIQIHSPILADTVAAKSTEGIENIATRLYRQTKGIRTIYDFSSDARLKEGLSSLFKSVRERELLIQGEENEIVFIILTKIYLISKGYRNVFISYQPFSDSLSSNEEDAESLKKIMDTLMNLNFVASKAWGTISITHQGIKKVENLLEVSPEMESNLQPSYRFMDSIGKTEKTWISEIQKLRYEVLRQAYDLSPQAPGPVNLFKIGEPLGIEHEKLQRIYFYLEDEDLIDFYALGGDFIINDKGKKLIETPDKRRIF